MSCHKKPSMDLTKWTICLDDKFAEDFLLESEMETQESIDEKRGMYNGYKVFVSRHLHHIYTEYVIEKTVQERQQKLNDLGI